MSSPYEAPEVRAARSRPSPAPQPPVRQPAPPAVLSTLHWRAVGLFSIVVGAVFWLIGARYTVLGLPDVIAFIFGRFGILLRPELPIGWPLLWLTIVIGATISAAEFGCYPRRQFFDRALGLGVALLLIWLVANAADLASTYVGVTTIALTNSASDTWVATHTWAAALWTLFLSYTPELIIFGGVRWLFKGGF